MLTLSAAWLKKILYDEMYASQLLRGGVMLISGLIFSGAINLGALGWWGSIVGMAASVVIRSGNKTTPTDIAKVVEDVLAQQRAGTKQP